MCHVPNIYSSINKTPTGILVSLPRNVRFPKYNVTKGNGFRWRDDKNAARGGPCPLGVFESPGALTIRCGISPTPAVPDSAVWQ